MQFTIGVLSKHAGVSKDTLRYYEKLGLIPPAIRSHNRYRVYSKNILKTLQLIKHAKQVGFTLSEIKQLLSLKENSTTVCVTVKNQIEEKIKEVENNIRELNTAKKELGILLSQCENPNNASKCNALESLAKTTSNFK